MSNSPWMTVRDAAAYRRCSHDTIERNRVPWTEQAPPAGQWRYKLMQNGKLAMQITNPGANLNFKDLSTTQSSLEDIFVDLVRNAR